RPLHAGGHPRAHDRQPRRQARQLRPAREEPLRRRALVGVRPGAFGLGLLRAAGRRARIARRRSRLRPRKVAISQLLRPDSRVNRSYPRMAMAKDTEKLIRQLSLISFLMAERRPVTALEIKQEVEGYSDMNDEAF